MAKCPMCNSRKGKRKCALTEALVCSQCCGQTRKEESCHACSYYKPQVKKRAYSSVPRYAPAEMEWDPSREAAAYAVESALCLWDRTYDWKLRDESVLKVLELLLVRYHFKDEEEECPSALREGFDRVVDHIQKLRDIPEETIVRILSTVYTSVKTHTQGRREYLDFIAQMVLIPPNLET